MDVFWGTFAYALGKPSVKMKTPPPNYTHAHKTLESPSVSFEVVLEQVT